MPLSVGERRQLDEARAVETLGQGASNNVRPFASATIEARRVVSWHDRAEQVDHR